MDEEISSPALSENGDLNVNEEIKIDTSKVQLKFEKKEEDVSLCSICGKHVYQMEKVKAEKRLFHRTCFRCKQCSKQLSMDTYSSHEGELYCQIHFKLLFQPKAKFDNSDDIAPQMDEVAYYSVAVEAIEGKQRKNEMIIRENVPQELPPDVVRCDSKADDGLEKYQLDLSNIRQRFESGSEDRVTSPFSLSDSSALQRSESVLARLQRYQSAVTGERKSSENGYDSSESELSDDDETDSNVVRETKRREKIAFSGLSSLKSQWESGSVPSEEVSKEEEKKEQLYRLRQRICLGRSASMRQVYENACHENNVTSNRSNSVHIDSKIKAVSLKEKFEKGEIENETEEEERLRKLKKEKEEDLSVVVEAETAAREAKNLFKKMDESSKDCSSIVSPTHSQLNGFSRSNSVQKSDTSPIEVVKCSDPSEKEQVVIETNQLQERFKFFECFKEPESQPKRFEMTPPPEPKRNDEEDETDNVMRPLDPNIIRSSDVIEDLPKTDTAKKMLSKFKQMEENQGNTNDQQTGPKPLKRITPPREYTKDDDEEKDDSPDRDPNVVRSSYKTEDIVPVEPEKARSLKQMFENWPSDVERENKRNAYGFEEEFPPKLDITKNLCAKFEAIKSENGQSTEKPKPRVNRFVNELGGVSASDMCNICGQRLYPMEKLEFSGMKMHKNCFKCSRCCSSLRLDNYTLAAHKLYCLAHFKQLFMSKGNYDEGFGQEQHKEKWNGNTRKSSSSNASIGSIERDDNENELIVDS
ncbi:reticulocyte-binding protein 2-like isoform X4 [Dinothrombium tinctorium]|uniref:Reticulocyte-binding protein 2-like isoform X4 n=1 Tax=Dinothrombium tinctorium TaxID=1965070 RepID=A0A443QQN4_9ACAR|nr:reticulocyte-binding protein 2-like isoform X4 [Dinothrombium tinctorium]